MVVRRKLAGRSEDGRKVYVVTGDPLPWRYDRKEDAHHTISKDGRAKYIVAKSRPGETKDKFGHKLFRYWEAWVKLADEHGKSEMINLGENYMLSLEGKEVCEIYDSARLEPKQLPSEPLKLEEKK